MAKVNCKKGGHRRKERKDRTRGTRIKRKPRPYPNPFFNWMRCLRKRDRYKGWSGSRLAVEAGRLWRRMSDEQKSMYRELAKQAQRERRKILERGLRLLEQQDYAKQKRQHQRKHKHGYGCKHKHNRPKRRNKRKHKYKARR